MTATDLSADAIEPRTPTVRAAPTTGGWAFAATVAVAILGFVLAPWPAAVKFQAALHGLCAQRPSHSFTFGGLALPFDARMTGIYGGALVTAAYLATRGRWRSVGLPSRSILIVLGALIAIMGLDGVNSTLQDFGLPFAYEPDNRLRLATGLGAGVVLVTALLYVVSGTLWANPARGSALRLNDLLPLALLQTGVFALVLSGAAWLYVPLATMLLASAVGVVLLLALSLTVLAAGRDNRIGAIYDLGYLPSVALLLAALVVGSLAAARFLLEHLAGIPLMP